MERLKKQEEERLEIAKAEKQKKHADEIERIKRYEEDRIRRFKEQQQNYIKIKNKETLHEKLALKY